MRALHKGVCTILLTAGSALYGRRRPTHKRRSRRAMLPESSPPNDCCTSEPAGRAIHTNRPYQPVTVPTLRPFANDRFLDRRLAIADPEQKLQVSDSLPDSRRSGLTRHPAAWVPTTQLARRLPSHRHQNWQEPGSNTALLLLAVLELPQGNRLIGTTALKIPHGL